MSLKDIGSDLYIYVQAPETSQNRLSVWLFNASEYGSNAQLANNILIFCIPFLNSYCV